MKRQTFLWGLIILSLSCGPDTDLLQNVLLTPSKVTLVFPENNTECLAGVAVSETESEIVFDWADAEVGDGYLVNLVNLSNGQETVYESDSSSLAITLLRSTPYQWSVTSFLDNSDELTESDLGTFYNTGPGIESYIPFPATAISPRNGEQLASTTSSTALQWEATDLDEDIVEYDVYFGTDTPPSLYDVSVNDSSFPDIPVVSGSTYYWKVVVRDSLGNESDSKVFHFTIAD